MTTELAQTTRALPATLERDTAKMGYSLLRGLDRLGFSHIGQDGQNFSVRFDAVTLYGARYAAYSVDLARLWHFSVSDLAKPSVLAQLSGILKKPVKALAQDGFAFVVELSPKPKTALPQSVTLDLAERPALPLAVPLGVGRDGAHWRGLPDLGHILLVGATGSGKSTWSHAALAALLTASGPDVLRLALVDPKRSELTVWGNAPHLIAPIANTEPEAARLMAGLVQEVDRRGELLGAALVRDVRAYNRQAAEPLPYVLCVIDECLDLVLSGGGDISASLKTMAVRGRSAGVYLWAATQHAAAVTGLPRVVNVNLATRLVFRVGDRAAADSAGCPGAESLPRDRPGRMLAKTDCAALELQAYHLDDADLLKVTRKLAGDKPSGPTLSEAEAALIDWSLASNDGYLALGDISRKAGLTIRQARRLAEAWERKGWLEKDASKGNTRRLVPSKLGRVSG